MIFTAFGCLDMIQLEPWYPFDRPPFGASWPHGQSLTVPMPKAPDLKGPKNQPGVWDQPNPPAEI